MTRTLVGVYSDTQGSNSPQEFAAWLGANPDLVSVYGGQANASDYETSVSYELTFQGWTGPRCISLPLLYDKGPTLAQAGTGAMDSEWTSALQSVLNTLSSQSIIYLRTGWEFNGTWEDWTSVPGSEGVFITCWQRFVNLARSLDTKNQFRYVWCWCQGQNNPGPSYPGNGYVDVISLDIYWQLGQPTDFNTWMLNAEYGLGYAAQLGQQYGKPISIAELGLGSNNLAQSTTDMFTWAASNNVAYINLWDSNGAYAQGGQLSNGQYPLTGAAFRSAALTLINGNSSGSSTPAPASTSQTVPPSATGATLTTVGSGTLYDSVGNAYTLVQSGGANGVEYAVNGTAVTSSSQVVKLAWDGTTMKQLNSSGAWYTAPATGGATTTTAPTATLAAASAAYTTLTTTTGALYDSAGNAYTLVQSNSSGQQIAINGWVVPSSGRVTELEYDGSAVKQFAGGTWYTVPANGSTGVYTTAPVAPAAPSTPPTTGSRTMAEINAVTALAEQASDDPLNVSLLGAPAIIAGTVYAHKVAGLVLGSGQTQSVRTNNLAVLQSALTYAQHNNKYFEIEPNTYETYGTLVADPNYLLSWHGSKFSVIRSFNPAVPAFQMGGISSSTNTYCTGSVIDGFGFDFGASVSSGNNAALMQIGAAFQCQFKKGNLCSYYGSNPPGYGLLINSSNTTNAFYFSNIMDDITIGGGQISLFCMNIGSTGNIFRTMYTHAGSSNTTRTTLSSHGWDINISNYGQTDSNIFEQCNIEHLNAFCALHLSGAVMNKFVGLHVEDLNCNSSYGAVIDQSGNQVSLEDSDFLDIAYPSGQTNMGIFRLESYGEVLNVRGVKIKWSGYNGTQIVNSPVQLLAVNSGGYGPGNAYAKLTNIQMEDDLSGGGNLKNVTIDPTLNLPFSGINGDYKYDYWLPTIDSMGIYPPGNYTHYGACTNCVIFAPSSGTVTLTLSNKRKPSGAGSNVPTASGTIVRVTTSGTNTVTIVDAASGGTLQTSTTSGNQYFFAFNGTNWVEYS